jgi:hypothetical protein
LDEERSVQKKGGDELPDRILDGAVRIKKREDQLRRKTHDLYTRDAKGTEFECGIFEHVLNCNKFIISTLN